MGRIEETHPAPYGIVRVVTIQQANKKRQKRTITKLIQLGRNNNDESAPIKQKGLTIATCLMYLTLTMAIINPVKLNQRINTSPETTETTNRTIKGINGISENRRKRGLLGEFLTEVFGVNNEVYQDIDALQKISKRSFKHQTTRLGSWNFTEKLNQGLEAVQEMQKWYKAANANTLNMNILHAYQLAAHYMEEVQQQHDLLLDVLFNRGHIYELLTPAEVAKFIEQATTKLLSKLKILLKPVLKTSVQRSREEIWVYSYFNLRIE
ncbi:hypothetical protein WA026_017690 [Henosepilachna vigintioctopunctata]|uniref:Uncharacterized protein n=1 Tax=Henosepilachna vigintioctopunctata TaxID=420089 RepID=A0AAW1U414_9CUCU